MMKQIIGIIDYGCGNIRSVANGLIAIGANYKVIESVDDIEGVSKLILPGVGSYDVAMRSLEKMDMIHGLETYLKNTDHKLLGICLGMQLLCKRSEEGELDGLGFLDAEVLNLRSYSSLKVPHMGWNTVRFTKQNPLIQDLGGSADFYFVHSYCVMVNDNSAVGKTNHGVDFVSVVSRGNIWGVQFHPEKSQGLGLRLLRNFVELC